MNLRSVGSCYLWCWGPAIPKSGQGPAFRVVSSYASALPEQLCACRLAPPCTRRERVTRPRGEDHEDLRAARQSLRVAGPGCLCRSTAQPLREPIAGARRRPKLSEFSRTLADTFTRVTPTRTRRSARVMHRGRASDYGAVVLFNAWLVGSFGSASSARERGGRGRVAPDGNQRSAISRCRGHTAPCAGHR